MIVYLPGTDQSTLALHIVSLGTDCANNNRAIVERAGDYLDIPGVRKMPRVKPLFIEDDDPAGELDFSAGAYLDPGSLQGLGTVRENRFPKGGPCGPCHDRARRRHAMLRLWTGMRKGKR